MALEATANWKIYKNCYFMSQNYQTKYLKVSVE